MLAVTDVTEVLWKTSPGPAIDLFSRSERALARA